MSCERSDTQQEVCHEKQQRTAGSMLAEIRLSAATAKEAVDLSWRAGQGARATGGMGYLVLCCWTLAAGCQKCPQRLPPCLKGYPGPDHTSLGQDCAFTHDEGRRDMHSALGEEGVKGLMGMPWFQWA